MYPYSYTGHYLHPSHEYEIVSNGDPQFDRLAAQHGTIRKCIQWPEAHSRHSSHPALTVRGCVPLQAAFMARGRTMRMRFCSKG